MKRFSIYWVVLTVLALAASMSAAAGDYKSECKAKQKESARACKEGYGRDHDRGHRDECNKNHKREYDDCVKRGKDEHGHDHDHK